MIDVDEAEKAVDAACPARVNSGGVFCTVSNCAWPGHLLRSAAYRSGLEASAKVADLWAFSPSCDPAGTCTHIIMGEEVAKRIRSLAAKEDSDEG